MTGQAEGHGELTCNPTLWHEIKKHWVAYVYISPFYILFAIFGAFPILFSFYLSFQQWRGNGPMQFIGLTNYINLFHDPLFWKAFSNTVIIWIATHVPMLLLALVLAFVLNSGLVKFQETFKALYFTPMVTSSVAVSLVFMTIYGLRFGLINSALKWIGLPQIDWWGGTGFWIKPAIIILLMWRWTGWNMVIYLAGLQGIDPELYEAAKIDGANLRQIFWYITLPLLRPVILFSLILSFIGGITVFDEPYLLTWRQAGLGGTNNAGLTMAYYMYERAFMRGHLGYAAALAYVICALILVLSIVNMKLFGKSEQAK